MYDVSDYTSIHPLFGTLRDFDQLLAEVDRRGMKLWRDPAAGGGPPNNWLSNFGGSAWEFDPASGQYYYHAFLKQQPDLNWRNPEVRAVTPRKGSLQRGIGREADQPLHSQPHHCEEAPCQSEPHQKLEKRCDERITHAPDL